MVDKYGEESGRHEQELDAERVVGAVVGRLELDVHEIECAERGDEIEDLHERVVHRDEVSEQVEVASREHERKQQLTLARYACCECLCTI